MRILALDLATKTGFAFGAVEGEVKSGSARMKRPDEHRATAWCNVGAFCEDRFVFNKPDLVVVEAAMPPGAMPSGDAVMLQWGLVAVVTFVCWRAGIRLEEVNAQKVSKHFTGKARWSKEDGGRAAKKKAAVQRAQLLGYIPRDCNDDDRADACALWDYAAATWGGKRAKELVLYGEEARG